METLQWHSCHLHVLQFANGSSRWQIFVWVCSVIGKSAHAFWKEAGSTSDHFYRLFSWGILSGLMSSRNVLHTEGFLKLLKALGKFPPYHPSIHPSMWLSIVQWWLLIFSINTDHMVHDATCGPLSIYTSYLEALNAFFQIHQQFQLWFSSCFNSLPAHRHRQTQATWVLIFHKHACRNHFQFTRPNSRSAQDSC